jgi:hypothetical protein
MGAWERLEMISKDPTLTGLFTTLKVDPVIGLQGGDSPKYDVVKLGRKHPESVIAGAVAEAVSCVHGASKSGPGANLAQFLSSKMFKTSAQVRMHRKLLASIQQL